MGLLFQSVNILGVRVHNVSMLDTLAFIEQHVQGTIPHHIATVNPEWIVAARRNEQFRNIINDAALSVPDGVGVLLAARVLGQPMPERVTGADMVGRLARIAAKHKLRLFMLGAAPGVADRAARVLEHENPGLRIAGTFAGSPDPIDEDEIIHKVLTVKPHILLVAYGAPKSEFWIHRNLQRLNVPIVIGVGGTFDFIAGVSRRAPRWIQRIGLEWFFRLVCEPSRWRRMLALPRFAGAVVQMKFLGNP